jgi:phosphoribosylanthranilate isomerase
LLADSRIPSNAAENGSKLDIGFLRQIIKYSSKPVITAGGINPENVCDFIEKTKTSFIDVMTGIEKSPGEKDIRMLSELLLAVKKFQP